MDDMDVKNAQVFIHTRLTNMIKRNRVDHQLDGLALVKFLSWFLGNNRSLVSPTKPHGGLTLWMIHTIYLNVNIMKHASTEN